MVATEGKATRPGDDLVMILSMKMEHAVVQDLKSPATVVRVVVAGGDAVQARQPLMLLRPQAAVDAQDGADEPQCSTAGRQLASPPKTAVRADLAEVCPTAV